MIADIRAWLVQAALGLVSSLGSPSAPLALDAAPDGKGSVGLVRDGYKQIALPGRTRGKRRHTFEDVDSLALWLNRHASPEACEVLVGPDSVGVALTPREVDSDVATCPLSPHPRWARWAHLLGKTLTQKDLHRAVLSAPEDFLPVTAGDGTVIADSYGPMLGAELAKFAMSKLKEVSIDMDERGITTFAAVSEKVTVNGKLPRSFTLRLPMLLGIHRAERRPTALDTGDVMVEAEYGLEILLGVEPSESGPPTFVLRCPQLAVLQREARMDAAAWLQHLLAGGFLVGLGTLSTVDVAVVEPAP